MLFSATLEAELPVSASSASDSANTPEEEMNRNANLGHD